MQRFNDLARRQILRALLRIFKTNKKKKKKKKRDNYSKPTCGMTRFHFTYPWFKTLHFAHLNFNPLPTSVKTKGKNVFFIFLFFYISLLQKQKIT